MGYGLEKDEEVEIPGFRQAFDNIEEAIRANERKKLIVKLEKEFRKKYSQAKGRNITVRIHCTVCTRTFEVKGKNNKSDDTEKQLCPHMIFKNWEVKHDGS